MYELQTLKVKDWHLFQKAEFDFQKGITRVGGGNRSGKSLLFAAIPTIFSIIHAKDDWEKPPKASTLELSYYKDEIPIDVLLATPSSSKYSIAVGGEDMKPHKIGDAKNLLTRNWTIPQELFNSTIFLGSDIHALRQGTPGTRSAWLSKALDLTSVYDAYKQEADEHIARIGRAFDKQQVLESEREKTLERLPDSQISKKAAKRAEAKIKSARAKYKTLPNERQNLERVIDVLEKLDGFPDITLSLEEIETKLDKYRVERAEVKKAQSEFAKIREDQEHNSRIQAKIDRLMPEFRGTPVKESNVELKRSKLEKMQRIVDKYNEERALWFEQSSERNELFMINTANIQTNNLEEAENLLSATVYRGTQTLDALEAMRALKPGSKKCPTCGNKITSGHLIKERKKLALENKVMPETIAHAKEEVRYWKLKRKDFIDKPAKPSFTSSEFKMLARELEVYDQVTELKSKLRKVSKVSTKNLSKQARRLDKFVGKYDKMRRHLLSITAYRGMLPAAIQDESREFLVYYKEEQSERLSQVVHELEHCNQVLDKYGQVASKYETQRKLISQHRSTVTRLEDEIAELKKQTRDLDAWKANAEAFGTRGLRLDILRDSAATLSAELTRLSSLFFDVTYQFHIEVGMHKLDVQAERNGKVGRLKTLSGSETSSWNLLCAMALLQVIPANMRCDTIILDEVESKMDEHSKQRLLKDVLPELQTIVPKIVYITPLVKELPLQPDYDYRVIKNYVRGDWVSSIMSN